MKSSQRVQRDAARLWRFCVDHARPDEARVRGLVDRLIERHHADALPILAQIRRRLRLDEARWSACVESATPLDTREREDIDAALVRLYGDGLVTTFEVNPSLIGGIRIRAGSDVYDGSVRARLHAIERSF